MWPRSTQPVQSCMPPLKVTGMFKPATTGIYASTNAVYRHNVIERCSNLGSPNDSSEVYAGERPVVNQPGTLPDVHLVNDNEELLLVPFRDTVDLHQKIIPAPRQIQSNRQVMILSLSVQN